MTLAVSACGLDSRKAYQEGQKAQALLDAGDLPGARKAITRALSYSDDKVELLLLDGQIKYMMRDVPAAYDAYSTVLALDPSNATALQAVSQLGIATGHQLESKAATAQILAADPKQAEALLISGVQAINDKDYAVAASMGDRLLAALPSDPRGVVLKARAAFLQGKRSEAMAQLRDAATKLGNNDLVATALLECARDQGDFRVMLEQYALLRRTNPDSVDLAIDEANVRYKSGDIAGARQIGIELLDKHGDDNNALGRLADLWSEYDPQPIGATPYAALVESGKMGARIAVARLYFYAGDYTHALEVLGTNRDTRIAGLRARILLASGDPVGATVAEQVLKVDNSNCEALAARAEVHLAGHDPNGAVVSAQQVASECPDRNDGFLLLARAYKDKKLSSGVERAFADGIAMRPLDRPLTAGFSEWLISQNRGSAAVGAARRLTQVAPGKASAWRLLSDMCQRTGDPICRARAEAGLAAALHSYVIDLPPGMRSVNPLLGQSWM